MMTKKPTPDGMPMRYYRHVYKKHPWLKMKALSELDQNIIRLEYKLDSTIELATKWEKVVKSASPAKAEEYIRVMANGIRPLKDGYRLADSRSEKLLARSLYPSKIGNINEARVRLKETMRDARDTGERWRKSSRKNLHLRRKMVTRKPTQASTGDPESMVGIIHGGGERYLKGFLSGKKKGYALEGQGGKGVQVHRIDAMKPGELRSRTRFYANRAAESAHDTPAMLTGKVKLKHLMTANNSYESAVADPSHIVRPRVSRLRRLEPIPKKEYMVDSDLVGTTKPIRKMS